MNADLNMQSMSAYDAEADTRLVKAAYDFNLRFVAKYPASQPPQAANSSGA